MILKYKNQDITQLLAKPAAFLWDQKWHLFLGNFQELHLQGW